MTYAVLKKDSLAVNAKLHVNIVRDFDITVAEIAKQLSIGERKRDNLDSLFV
jgi:predicted regulator of Ras-like GTPase activity (Roadblock/LC7/MglB family)